VTLPREAAKQSRVRCRTFARARLTLDGSARPQWAVEIDPASSLSRSLAGYV
jgi:hypothetical protein